MSFVEDLLDRTKRMEGLLERNYGATGSGLHNKLSSVSGRFNEKTIKDVHYIATIRNKIAHEEGYKFDGDEQQLLSLCDQVIEVLQNPLIKHHPNYQKRSEPPSGFAKPNQSVYSRQIEYRNNPWYRSTLFLLLTFFLVPLLWAILILTDSSKGWFLKLIAGLSLIPSFVYSCVFLPSFLSIISSETIFENLNPFISSKTQITQEPSLEQFKTQPMPNPVNDTGCKVVWIEYQGADFAGKNRSMVWDEIVRFEIKDSTMTAKEFYKLVVEKNPILVNDGYVFLDGKSYFLPICE